MKSTLSVIIPVFNTEKYLYRCIESITNQTYKNLQIILVDDGSTDSSFSICKEFENKDPRVSVFSNNGKGVSSARNYGMSKADGEYITFVDSDDYLELNAYEKALNNIGNCDAIFFGYYEDYENLDYIKPFAPCYIGCVNNYRAIYNSVFPYENNYFTSVWNKIFKKDKVKDIPFDESFTVGEDEEWLVRSVLNLSNIMLYNEPLYYYVQRSDSTLRSIEKISKNWLLQVKAKEEVLKLLSNNNECYNAAVPKEYGDMFSLVAYSYITDGYSKSIEVYKKIDKYKKIFLLSKNYSFRRKVKYLLIYLFIKLRMPKRWVMNLWNVNYLRIISHLKIK